MCKKVKQNSLLKLIVSAYVALQLMPMNTQRVEASSPLHDSSPVFVSQTTTSNLTETKLMEIMGMIEQAEKEENIDVILKYLVPYIITTVTVDTDETTITTLIEGREKHREYLENNFKRVKNRNILSNYVTMDLDESEEIATVVRVRSSEINTEDGKTYISLSTDKIRFGIVDNEPRIVNIESKGWVEPMNK